MTLCARCGAEKDLPLGRCPACRHAPSGEDRLIALVCSTRVSPVETLLAAQARIRRGEGIRPTPELIERARRVLSGVVEAETRLTSRQICGIIAANLVLTPVVGYAVWHHYRSDRGPAARQALLTTLPCSFVLAVALYAWHSQWSVPS